MEFLRAHLLKRYEAETEKSCSVRKKRERQLWWYFLARRADAASCVSERSYVTVR